MCLPSYSFNGSRNMFDDELCNRLAKVPLRYNNYYNAIIDNYFNQSLDRRVACTDEDIEYYLRGVVKNEQLSKSKQKSKTLELMDSDVETYGNKGIVLSVEDTTIVREFIKNIDKYNLDCILKYNIDFLESIKLALEGIPQCIANLKFLVEQDETLYMVLPYIIEGGM